MIELCAQIDKDKDNDKEKRLEDKIKDLEEAVKQFKEEKLEDIGDLTKAKDCLEKIKLEKGLKDAIRKRSRLGKVIQDTEESKFKENFKTLLCKAKEVHDDMRKQGKYMYPIPKLSTEIITELRGYKQPSQVIQDVVLAALILLGEKKDTLQDWETVRYQMGP